MPFFHLKDLRHGSKLKTNNAIFLVFKIWRHGSEFSTNNANFLIIEIWKQGALQAEFTSMNLYQSSHSKTQISLILIIWVWYKLTGFLI